MVSALKLNENPKIASLVRGIAVAGNEKAAQKLAKRLAKDFYEQKIRPDWFISRDGDLGGDVVLGFTDGGVAVGQNDEEKVRHTGIFGGSGFGKTSLMKSHFLQSKRNGTPVIYIDRKNDMDHAAREGVDVIYWQKFRINCLCPGDSSLNIYEYRNEFTKLFADHMNFMARGQSVFLMGLDELYRKYRVYERWNEWDWSTMEFPTTRDLLALFKGREFFERIKGQGKESLLSIIDKLESLMIELGVVLDCQRGFDLAGIYKEKRAINLSVDGLGADFQDFLLLTILLQFSNYFKTHGPRNTLNLLLYFDEAKGILGKQNQDKFIIKDIVSKIREWGIGLVCADQIPSEISQFFFSNIGTLIMFRHSDGFDLHRLRISSGATPEQALENYSLKPGEAIVRTMRSKDLLRIKVPFEPVEKFISRAEVQRIVAPRLEEFYRDVIPSKAKDEQRHPNAPVEGTSGFNLDETERAFLEALARDFDRPGYLVTKELGLGSSAGFRLKKRLLGKRLISQVTTNLGKEGKLAKFLIPNPVVFEELGIPIYSGRGKLLHKHFQSKLKSQAEQHGFEAAVEESRNGTPEAPDVALWKTEIGTAIEICITSKPATEVKNIEKNFRLGYSHVVLSFVNRQVMHRTQQLANEAYPKEQLQRVRFSLIHEVVKILGEP